ncbi:hypothetical protein ACK9YZ_20420 [Rhizobium sp. ZK1]|uniref:hypothetical protein n=1 Tax=Rhizobium sp. ZK1 TaxID=3389872 RepID=UPI0039F6FCE0
MRRIGVALLALFCLTGMANAANNGTTANLLYFAKRGDQNFRSLFTGAGRGLEAANLALERQGEKKLYCQPDIAITEDQYIRIVESYIEEKPKDGEIPAAMFGVTMLLSLVKAFPCN